MTASYLWVIYIITSIFYTAIDRHFYGYAACPPSTHRTPLMFADKYFFTNSVLQNWCVTSSNTCSSFHDSSKVSFLFLNTTHSLLSKVSSASSLYHNHLPRPRQVPQFLSAFFNKIVFFVGQALKKLKLCCHFL